jgi:aldehyde:ferredoxin oxidoreductase
MMELKGNSGQEMEVEPACDPVGKDNALIMATGPLTGAEAPTGARYMMATKSPLTGSVTCSNAGGHFPAEPVYLWINGAQHPLRLHGTAVTVRTTQNFGVLPTRNFQQGTFEGWEAIHGETLTRKFLVGAKACFSCRIGCGRVTSEVTAALTTLLP